MMRPMDLEWSFISLIEGLGGEAKALWSESPEKFMANLAELSRKAIVEKVKGSIEQLRESISLGEAKLAEYQKILDQYETILKHYDTAPADSANT